MAARDFALFRVWLIIGAGLLAIVLYGCFMHNPPNDPNLPDFDKAEHFIAFFGLAVWFAALLAPRYLAVFVALAFLGAAIEVGQYYSGYRDGDPMDWLTDCAGAVAGIVLARYGAARCLRYIDQRVTANRNRTG